MRELPMSVPSPCLRKLPWDFRWPGGPHRKGLIFHDLSVLLPQMDVYLSSREESLDQTGEPADLAANQVRETLTGNRGVRRVSGYSVRWAAGLAAAGSRSLGSGAGHMARTTVEGAVRAAGEITGETTAFVRDAVIGVVEGTGQVVQVTTPAVKEVVAGAIRGAGRASGEVTAASQKAVEGAIVGATSVGINSAEAASAAVDGAVEAVVEAGGDLQDAARATIGGVISGVSTIGGDVSAAVRDSAGSLVGYAAAADQSAEEVAGVAAEVVDTALSEAEASDSDAVEAVEVVSAAADAAIAAAYEVSRAHGDRAREEVLRAVAQPRVDLGPELQRQLSEISKRLSDELPKGRAAWRGYAMVRAVRLLLRAGASDQAASLAYFTVLSFFPLMALVVIAFALVSDAEAVATALDGLLSYYFPASSQLFHESVGLLVEYSGAFGPIALIGAVVAGNGLFMAANRTVNRVFGVESHQGLRGKIIEAAVTGFLGIVLLLSVGISAFVQVASGLAGGNLHPDGEPYHSVHMALGVGSALFSAAVTGIVFTVVYHNVPHTRVEWKDAAFGGMVSLFLFEVGKHLFLWISGLAAQRDMVYGPVASTVVLLLWAYYAGLIFLYGAALVRAAGELRPKSAGRIIQAGPGRDLGEK